MPASEPIASQLSADPLPPRMPRGELGRSASPYTSPWLSAPTSTEPRRGPVGCTQFVLDANDLICAHRVAETDRWFYQEAKLEGKTLRTLLVTLRPEWTNHLPARLVDGETSLFLPEAIPGSPACVLAVHRLRSGERLHVTLTPELAPSDSLRHAGLADLSPEPATLAKLFLRLRSVESRLDHYLSHLPGVVFNQRADLSFAFVGPGCESLLGIAPQSFAKDSQALLRLIHPSDERAYYHELDRHAESAKPFSLVYRVLNPTTGAYLHLLDVRSPVRAGSGLLLGYEGVWLDITRQKLAEHRLTTRTWKESLCTLTGGLLNDFSSAMTGIYSLSELYHNTLPLKHPLRDGLGLIKDNAAQAQQLVRKIVDLNREASGEKVYTNLGKLVRDQFDVIKLVLPRGSQIQGPYDDGDWPVYLDETAFRQTLVNLAVNTRDALRGPGEVRITLRRLNAGETVEKTVPAIAPLAQPAVEFTFSDNGAGIAPAHLARIFDPFFTTRESTRGAGLGLYNARLFAESHGGQIAARSTPGRGTDIVLVLPIADLSIAGRGLKPNTPAKHVRILYFEPGMSDEGPLIDCLRHREWTIRTVSTASHARRVLAEEGVRIDLVLVRQPDVDADLRVFLAELHRDHAGLPVAVHLTAPGAGNHASPLRTQVDLLLSAGIRDPEVADSLAKLLRMS